MSSTDQWDQLSEPVAYQNILRHQFGEDGLDTLGAIVDQCVQTFVNSRTIHLAPVIDSFEPDWLPLTEETRTGFANTIRMRLAELMEELSREFNGLEFGDERHAELDALINLASHLRSISVEPVLV